MSRRDTLLEAGLTLFSEHAYDELSIDEIGARLGVAKGLVYYYFGSKRGYYVAVVRAAAEELRELWDVDPSLPPDERLARGVDAYLRYAEEHVEGFRALMGGGIGFDGEVRAIIAEEREGLIALIADGLGVATPTAPLRAALQGWLSFIEGATIEWLDAGELDRDAMRELLLRVFWAAVEAAS